MIDTSIQTALNNITGSDFVFDRTTPLALTISNPSVTTLYEAAAEVSIAAGSGANYILQNSPVYVGSGDWTFRYRVKCTSWDSLNQHFYCSVLVGGVSKLFSFYLYKTQSSSVYIVNGFLTQTQDPGLVDGEYVTVRLMYCTTPSKYKFYINSTLVGEITPSADQIIEAIESIYPNGLAISFDVKDILLVQGQLN